MIALSDSTFRLNSKQKKTLKAVFARPTSAALLFADIEQLVVALGGVV